MTRIGFIFSTLLLFLLTFSTQAQEERKVFQGFDGGMMIHVGYLQGEIAPLHYQAKGATFGLGGVARVHLGQHWMVGGEGYVSTLKQLKNGSFIKYGWGGLLGEFYWAFKRVMPYVGLTIGGGACTNLLMFDGVRTDWQPEPNAVFHKQTFMAIDPFIGCDFIISKSFHLTLKVDCLNGISQGKLMMPMGPRFYFGCIFFH
ncbi:MAG: hypothetical protein K6A41_02060 [Bacteroidales bacterium]|nr:hypothetical protein [Bacteroidales bacterium]